MRCGTTYYTPVPGITTVSLHGSALHIDTDIVDLPGWCGVPQFAMYEWMERKPYVINNEWVERKPPTEVEATITKAAEAIARKMGDTGKAVVLVPVWHIGGTGMAAILKHLVGKAGYDRVKVIYAIAGDKSPAAMRGGTNGGYNSVLTLLWCWDCSQGASYVLVEAMHLAAMGPDAIKTVVPDGSKFSYNYSYGGEAREICNGLAEQFAASSKRKAGEDKIRLLWDSLERLIFESEPRINEISQIENVEGAISAFKMVHAPTFPGVGGAVVTKCLVVYDDNTSHIVAQLADRPFVTKKLWKDVDDAEFSQDVSHVVLYILDMAAEAHPNFDRIKLRC